MVVTLLVAIEITIVIIYIIFSNYISYGWKNYYEAFTPAEFYERAKKVHKQSKEVRITSMTPGLILPSEYDPISYPHRDEKGYPERKEYFQVLKEQAEKGLKVKYFFDEEETKNKLKEYIKNGEYEYLNEGKKILKEFLKTGNVEVRYGKVLDKYKKYVIIGHVEDKKTKELIPELIIISERDKEKKKIRRGEFIRDKKEAKQLSDEFDENQWNKGKEVKDESVIDKLLDDFGKSIY